MVKKQINILLVEDHKLVSKLISEYFEKNYEMIKFSCANGYNEAIAIIESEKVDVAILDVMLTDGDGLELAQEILNIDKSIKIIFLTALNSKKVVLDAVKIGATGFLSKTAHLSEINNSIEFALKGEKYFCQETIKTLVSNGTSNGVESHNQNALIAQNQSAHDVLDVLTERESEIVEFLVNEYTIAEISDELSLSKRTIETHKKNILNKLGVKSTISLIKLYYERKYKKN